VTDDATTPTGDDRPAAPSGPDSSTAFPSFAASGAFPSSEPSSAFPTSEPSSAFPTSDPSGVLPAGGPGGGPAAPADAGTDGPDPGAGGPDPGTDGPDPGTDGSDAARRRRRLLRFGIAGAAVLILLVCGSFGAFAAVLNHFVDNAHERREVRARTDSACLDLERRLNRLVPPGAAANPGQRATAIRDENAAVLPFLYENDQQPVRWLDDDADGDDHGARGGWADGWHKLVDARSAYANALDRQVTNGEPAFFLAPQDRRGHPVLERLQRGPLSCTGTGRRLAAPDL
jgi:hypothetical protein